MEYLHLSSELTSTHWLIWCSEFCEVLKSVDKEGIKKWQRIRKMLHWWCRWIRKKLHIDIRSIYTTMIKAETTTEETGLLYALIEQNPALSICS